MELRYIFRDVSDWIFVSHGEKSTLEKEEIQSPEEINYLMKYPREFEDERVNWEDINEVIGAKIASLLGLKTIEAEIAYRNGKRGCLMLHFLRQYDAYHGEPGAPLLTAEFGNEYTELILMDRKNKDLLTYSFSLIERFTYFQDIKSEFINMNVFDILIGNQDRHPYNWQILYSEDMYFFGPLYDNGASLGWQLEDSILQELLLNNAKMNRFFNGMRVKCGLFEHTQPPIKATDTLIYLNKHYPLQMKFMCQLLENFDIDAYNQYIDQFPLISEVRKCFLKEFIKFRKDKIISTIREGAS